MSEAADRWVTGHRPTHQPRLTHDAFLAGLNTPPWMAAALCAQTDPEAFYPNKGGSTREAKQICLTCEVRTQCLDHALEHRERFGIWGGKSERERRNILRNQTNGGGET